MQPIIKQLLELAGSDDENVQNNAVVDLAMLLERDHVGAGAPDSNYEGLLTPELLAIKLKENEQREIVESLRDLAESDRLFSSMLWAIGMAPPNISLIPLLRLLRTRADAFDEETLHQALIALDHRLTSGITHTMASAIKGDDPTPRLEKLLKHENPLIAERAYYILKAIKRKT